MPHVLLMNRDEKSEIIRSRLAEFSNDKKKAAFSLRISVRTLNEIMNAIGIDQIGKERGAGESLSRNHIQSYDYIESLFVCATMVSLGLNRTHSARKLEVGLRTLQRHIIRYSSDSTMESERQCLERMVERGATTFVQDGSNKDEVVLNLARLYDEKKKVCPWLPDVGVSLDQFEQVVIEKILRENQGNQTHTALDLDISLSAIRRKVRHYCESDLKMTRYISHTSTPSP